MMTNKESPHRSPARPSSHSNPLYRPKHKSSPSRQGSTDLSELALSQLLLEGELVPRELPHGGVSPGEQAEADRGDGAGGAAGGLLQADDVGLRVVRSPVRAAGLGEPGGGAAPR